MNDNRVNADLLQEIERLRTCAEAHRTARMDALIGHAKRVKLLRDEITRLEFLNKEERETISQLVGHVVLLASALENADKYLPDRLHHTRLISEAREAVQ